MVLSTFSSIYCNDKIESFANYFLKVKFYTFLELCLFQIIEYTSPLHNDDQRVSEENIRGQLYILLS